jgi:hypothetical protein
MCELYVKLYSEVWFAQSVTEYHFVHQQTSATAQKPGVFPKHEMRPEGVEMHGELYRVCKTYVCFLRIHSHFISITSYKIFTQKWEPYQIYAAKILSTFKKTRVKL